MPNLTYNARTILYIHWMVKPLMLLLKSIKVKNPIAQELCIYVFTDLRCSDAKYGVEFLQLWGEEFAKV